MPILLSTISIFNNFFLHFDLIYFYIFNVLPLLFIYPYIFIIMTLIIFILLALPLFAFVIDPIDL